MVFLLSSFSLGCAEPAELDCSTEAPSGSQHTWVMRRIEFARFEGDQAAGFDLDDNRGKVCGHSDWDSPWGGEGVDNNLARLLPALENTEAVAVEAIIQQTINSGELLMMVQANGVDSFQEDACISVGVMRGEGPVEVGTDELLLPGQTLGLDPRSAILETDSSLIEGGVLSAAGFELSLPFQVFDVQIEFNLNAAQLRMEVDPETGFATGVAGGGIDVQDVLDVVNTDNVDQEVKDLLNPLLVATADLDPNGDGECEEISMAFHFEAVPAWLYEE